MDRPEITQLLFHPTQVAQNTPPEGATDFSVSVDTDVRVACRMHSFSKEYPTLIFFHGNGEIIPDYDEIGPCYGKEGINLLVAEYRGYGWSTGTPLTSTFLPDCNTVFLQALDWLKEQEYTGPVFVKGRSLGSACAIDIALNHSERIAGLIIESGFARTIPLAKTLGVDLEAMGLSEEDCFNNVGKIRQVEKPTYILHGQYDQLIPLWQSETLQAESGARKKEFQIIPGADHNSLIAKVGQMYFQAVKKFVYQAAGLTPSWRERRRHFKAQQQAQ